MDDDDIGKHTQAKSILKSTISEINIVEMKAVKCFIIKTQFLDYSSSHGDEYTIQSLDPIDEHCGHSIYIDGIVILIGKHNSPEHMPESSRPPTRMSPAFDATAGIDQ
ncbi:MAG: hypothetical protein U1F42_05050 [Candidatus Competibacteraceae bacterium]